MGKRIVYREREPETRALGWRDDLRSLWPQSVVTDLDGLIRAYSKDDPVGSYLLMEVKSPCRKGCRDNGCELGYSWEPSWRMTKGQENTLPLLDAALSSSPRYKGLWLVVAQHEHFSKSSWVYVRRVWGTDRGHELTVVKEDWVQVDWREWFGAFMQTGELP
jgi:hypothetical protein